MENANSVVPNFFNIFGQSEWYEWRVKGASCPEFRYFSVFFPVWGSWFVKKVFFFFKSTLFLKSFLPPYKAIICLQVSWKSIWNLYYFTKVVEIYALACRGAFTTLFRGFACSRISCLTSPSGKFVRKFQVFFWKITCSLEEW
jgi:hypothetical protein